MSSQDSDPTQPANTPATKHRDEIKQSNELGEQEELRELELPAEQSVTEWLAHNKISIPITLATALITGFVAGLLGPTAWHWYLDQTITPGHGTIIGGIFVVTAAAIVYTGTHLTRTSNERLANQRNELDTTNTQRAHDLTDTQELRRRFVTTTAQFADPSPEVRLAGVYALEALTDDWIDRGKHTDAQTCINYLCGYLTRPYTRPTEDPTLRTHTKRTHHTKYNYTDEIHEHPRDDLNVRQAITRTIANHLQPEHHHNWSNYNYDLTGAHFQNADFTGSHFKGTIDFTKANFQGEQTSFDDAEFHGERTSFNEAEFHGEQTSFVEAKFHGERTTFFCAEFHSERTWFGLAEFHSKRTTFRGAEFHGEQTSFRGAEFHSERSTFQDAEFYSELTVFEGAEFGDADFQSKWTLFNGAEFHGQQTSFGDVEFHSERTSFGDAEFRSERTWFGGAKFHSERTTFAGAKFHSERTTFFLAEFHSERTTFFLAEFHGKRTLFNEAKFHGKQTAFDNPRVWNNVCFDWDPEMPYAVVATRPDNVTPHDWPPAVEQNS
ncbi:pentapeptide repeat-containing protein [Rhodococcoides fascians]|uniref:pentapeptide repeat-containing protein n=1 Tax=Rhodococcoides fascians TaxID=1828 RepID=UPI0018AFA83C|nr:pentapeptide repeat-containing protein [Rhodococcus fascians]